MQTNPPLSPDYLEQKRQDVRARFSVRPLRPKEIQGLEDAHWAFQDPEVLATHQGEFVVAYQKRIVAHGTDAALVLAEAAKITGRPADELSLVGIVDPLLDIPH